MASNKEVLMAKWTEPLSNMLVSLLVEEVKKGNRTTCTFNKAGWNNIHAKFNKQAGLQFSVVQLKNRVNKLKRRYGSFKKLISQSGFGWDNVNKKVTVDDASVWDSHIKDNSEWAKFKNDGFPQYPQLCIVFADTYVTGEYAAGNVEDLLMSEGEDGGGGGGGAEIGDSEEFNEHHTNEGVFTLDMTGTPVREKHKLDRTPNSKRRKKSNTYDVSGTCKAIQELIKFRTGQSTSGSVTSHAPPPVDPYSIGVVIAVLNDMPNLEQDLYNKAVNQACVNATWREAFVISLLERRRGLIGSL